MINLERAFWEWIEQDGGLREFAELQMSVLDIVDEETSEPIEKVYFSPYNEYHGYSWEQAVQAEMSWLMEKCNDSIPEDWDK